MKRKNILLITISIASGVLIGFLGTMYHNFWKEPKAAFIETKNPKLIKVREDLEDLKSDLRKQGLYNCCIRNDCNWCALHMGHCPCGELIARGEAEKSCPECAAAWNRKQGKIPGVDPDAIEVTTFGIYGYEEGGHHHPGLKDQGDESDHHGDEHHNQEPYKSEHRH